jgi:alpha-mannosidase
MNFSDSLSGLEASGGGSYAALRAAAELDYAWRAAKVGSGEGAVEEAAALLAARAAARGGLAMDDVSAMEESLNSLSGLCKSLGLRCVGHAHIDMNWMWGYHETVAIATETMRTVLQLMERYPFFRFSQSQASVYRIVERYAPSLVRPIAERIAEGRWEPLATQWVEADMVLPSGESLVRQMSAARRYMRETYGAAERAFETVFLPDTFGYPASTPEILSSAGVRFLYHCRGAEDRIAYRWQAPSGREIIAYRDPRWYNTEIGSGIARFLPAFARDTGLSEALCVYGVGDHGGGPTMRDIERLADMASWPLFPKIEFGLLRDYFDLVAASKRRLPSFAGEPERLFTGCYASQSRIKESNARAQDALYEAELLDLEASLLAGERTAAEADRGGLREAWIDVLFGQFHDILPGSGTRETRERALGQFQGAMATALSLTTSALRAVAASSASAPGEPAPRAVAAIGGPGAWSTSRAEGAGVGFGAEAFRLSSAARAAGPERSFALFNQLPWERKSIVELVLWDWEKGVTPAFHDSTGATLPCQLVESSKEPYWGHDYAKYLVETKIEGLGFASIVAKSSGAAPELSDYHPYGKGDWLVERERSYVLENEALRAVFDAGSFGIVSLVNKATGRDLVEGRGPTCLFRLIEEDAPAMTAWIVGRRRSVTALGLSTRLRSAKLGGDLLEQWIEYGAELPAAPGVKPSSINVRVCLPRGAARLRFDADCDWRELGFQGECLKQLDFAVALAGEARSALRDIPCGVARSESCERDAPATSFMAAEAAGSLIQLTVPGRQSFRLEGGTLSATLLRGSIDPDPYPETGKHHFSISVSAHAPGAREAELMRESLELRRPPLAVSAPPFAPSAPPLRISGEGIIVSSLKAAEDSPAGKSKGGLVAALRLYETRGAPATAVLSGERISGLRPVDSHERGSGASERPAPGGRFEIALGPFEVKTVEITFSPGI